MGLAEVGGKDDGVGGIGLAACEDLPAVVGELLDALDSGFELEIDSLTRGEVDNGREELSERGGGDAEAASFGGAQEGLVEDLAGVLDGAAIEGVVESAYDYGFPEVTDGAFGLAGALEPGGEAFGVVCGVAAEEVHEAGGDCGLVA